MPILSGSILVVGTQVPVAPSIPSEALLDETTLEALLDETTLETLTEE